MKSFCFVGIPYQKVFVHFLLGSAHAVKIKKFSHQKSFTKNINKTEKEII